jgi:hypothetical protein
MTSVRWDVSSAFDNALASTFVPIWEAPDEIERLGLGGRILNGRSTTKKP